MTDCLSPLTSSPHRWGLQELCQGPCTSEVRVQRGGKSLSILIISCCCHCSVAQSCPTLCDPMDCSTPGLPVHHQLPDLTQTHVHWVSDAIRPSHPLLSPCSPVLSLAQHQGFLPMSQFFTSGVQSIGVSASGSVLPMNIQDWFPLGLTGLISLQSKEPSRAFSNTTLEKHQFFCTQLSL